MSEAFAALLHIRQACLENQQAIPDQRPTENLWSGIGFSLQGKLYVSGMNEISEILSIPEFTRIPGVDDWVKGIANVRGRLLPILDMVSFLYKEMSPAFVAKRKVLVVDFQDFHSGLVVDEVLGMQYFNTATFSSNIDHASVDEKIAPFVKGSFTVKGTRWCLFSPAELVTSPNFMKLAS